MTNNSLQGSLQEAIRSALGCANTFEGDLHALCDLYGVASGHQDARLIGAAQKHDSTIGTASGALNYFLLNPSVLPTFGLNFVDGTGRLDSRVTFTRASSGTRFDSTGTLVSMASDAPRFDYDPVTLAIRGLLIEEQRTNLLLRSAELDNAYWTRSFVTINADQATAPSGQSSADYLVRNSTSSSCTVQAVGIGLTGVQTYTASIYAKAGSVGGLFGLRIQGTYPSRADMVVNLATGVATFSAAVNFTIGAVAVLPVGNGWYRLTICATSDASGIDRVAFGPTTVSSGAWEASSVTLSDAYAWGAQLEAGSFATSYIPTTTAAATRAADVAVVSSLAGWFNANEMTVTTEWSQPLAGTYAVARQMAYMSDGTAANRAVIFINATSNTVEPRVTSGGVTSLGSGGFITYPTGANVVQKAALAVKQGTSQGVLCLNGTLGAAADITTWPPAGALTKLQIGDGPNGATQPLNGHYRRLTFYGSRLPNATLQAITA